MTKPRPKSAPTAKSILTEAMVQDAIVEALKAHGCTVLQTNLAKGRVIADKGVPDLIITHDGWPENAWLGMEVKKPGGKATPEQAALAARKRIVIVDNVFDAVAEYRRFISNMTFWQDQATCDRFVRSLRP